MIAILDKIKHLDAVQLVKTSMRLICFIVLVAVVVAVTNTKLQTLKVNNEVYRQGFVSVTERTKQLDCLTKNIYYEARGEDHRGRVAVAHVTLNRLKTGYWGNSICKVVYAKKQFSWTLAKKLPRPDSKVWAESEAIARKVLAGHRVRGLSRSLFYHATYIKDPKWADPAHEVGQIGNHVFYNKAKGSRLEI
jgi:spore germination cell wall hydrolase CwlJ-like protein